MAKITNKWITDGTITEAKLDINNSPSDAYILAWSNAQGKPEWIVAPSAATVSVSSNDTTTGYLNGKLVAVSGKTVFTENGDGGNETLSIGIGADIFDHVVDDTDDIANEGATNLWFTTARVDGHLVGGTGITYAAGDISITAGYMPVKIVEIVTLDATDISNGYNDDLTQVPDLASAVQVTPVGGPQQEYVVDFTIITDGADVKRINWSGLGMAGTVANTDKLIVSYEY